jgi:hypothetical protein
MRYTKLPVLLVALMLVALPWSAEAISSTTYQLDPVGEFSASHTPYDSGDGEYNIDSTSFQLEASIESIVGSTSSSSFEIETGGTFEYYCGDGFRDAAETCDTNDLNDATCASRGFDGGTLTCSSSCALVTSACTTSGGGGGGGGGGSPAVGSVSDPEVSDEIADLEFVYSSDMLLYGDMDDGTDEFTVDGDSTDVVLVDDDSWQVSVSLAYGLNSFTLVSIDGSSESDETIYEVYRRLVGDMNQDDTVDDYDLSQLVGLWGDDDREGDFNDDGSVDDYDFSMMVARWGTSV